MGEAGRNNTKAAETALEKDWRIVSGFLREHPDMIREDAELLADLDLRLRTENIVDFGPAALARLSEAKVREKSARIQLEQTARSNFAAQAQSHAAVVDILESRNHSDLARRNLYPRVLVHRIQQPRLPPQPSHQQVRLVTGLPVESHRTVLLQLFPPKPLRYQADLRRPDPVD